MWGRGSTHGFTLVELLVSFGVIMVVFGLLLPSLRGSKRAAEDAVQLKQMQQAGDLLALYCQGRDGQYPLMGNDQFHATAFWYEGLVLDGLLESAEQLDPKSARMGLAIPFSLSASMVTDAGYYTPGTGEYPGEDQRPVTRVRTDQVVFPSSKGALQTWRIGYPVEGRHIPWCCIDLSLRAPIGFADGSAERLSVEECYAPSPMQMQDMAGVPVYTTWHGVRERDR